MRHSMAHAAQRDVAPDAHSSGFAGRHPQLLLDDVDAGDHLGHGVLHLDAGVHLHEVELALVERGTRWCPRPGSRRAWQPVHAAGAHALAQLGVRRGRRRLLDDLLVAALDAALALAQVDDVAVPVAQHLHLDVPRAARCSARGRRRRPRRPGRRWSRCVLSATRQLVARLRTMLMPMPPPPRRGLDDHRVADLGGDDPRLVGAVHRSSVPGTTGTPAAAHLAPRRHLAAHAARAPAATGTDEGQPGVGAAAGEVRVLGQEAVAGVDGVGSRVGRRLRGSRPTFR